MSGKEIREFAFDGFRIDAGRRLLFKQGEVVPLMAKSFDLLLALVENDGQLVTKNELLERVWEDQFVSENNLSVHIAALRKALGETKEEHRYIVTVSGKGYRFVGDLNESNGHELVVERHRFQRIVVENADGISSLTEHGLHHGDQDPPSRSLGTPASEFATPSLGHTARRYVVFGAIVIAVLLAAGGGYWLIGRWSAPRPVLVPFAQLRIRQLTTNGKVGNAALSPDGKMFAYTIDDLGQKSLWLGFVDGGHHLQLREPAEATIRSLTFSSDSRELFFLLRDEKNPQTSLFRMPATGGVPLRLSSNVGGFALSPDAKQIAYAAPNRLAKEVDEDALLVGEVNSLDVTKVAVFPKAASVDTNSLSWSTDGKRLAAVLVKESATPENEIVVVEVATGNVRRLPHQKFSQITKTAWLSDGSGMIVTALGSATASSVPQYRLWFVSYPGGETRELTGDRSNYGASWHNDSGASLGLATGSNLLLTVEHRQLANIWIAPAADLSAAKQITFSSFGKYDGLWGLDWSPDGTLFYTTSDTNSQFIAHVGADGAGATDLTSPGYFDSVLTVSADGRYVLFHSNRGSQIDIWRMDRDGTNLKQLTFGGKGFHPAPSPDGKWVYYKSGLDGKGALFRVPIDGGESERVTTGDAWWPSFSPDGKYFAALYATDKNRLAIFSAATNELVKQFELPKSGTLYMGSRWTPDSKAVTFRDKNYGYWVQPIDGSPAHRLEGLPKERLYNFSWSRDGKWLAFVRGPEIRDVVLFESSSR